MTQLEVFNLAMPLIDETPVNGVFDADSTAEYREKAPFIITMIQNEICRLAPLYKDITITATTETASGYVKVTLPSDFISIYKIVNDKLEAQDDFKTIGNDLYVPYDLTGIIKYRYIPAAVSVLTEDGPFDDIIASTVIATGLGANLTMIEKPDISNYLSQKYEELKRDIKTKQPASISKRKDIYGASCRF